MEEIKHVDRFAIVGLGPRTYAVVTVLMSFAGEGNFSIISKPKFGITLANGQRPPRHGSDFHGG
jgi:hypothetical protein